MIRIACPGLDGSNPLHFLASLGILRSLPTHTKMGWEYRKGWNPWFETDVQDYSKRLSQAIRRGVEDHVQVRATKKKDGSTGKVECDPVDREKIQAAWGCLGFSDIPKVKPYLFRRASQAVLASLEGCLDPSHPAWSLSALNAENVTDKNGDLEPTAFSFSNGGGKQFLLKDFISLASLVSPAAVDEFIRGEAERFVWFTSLNWDPMALRSYATQWNDPESSPKATDVAANTLAFLGLACLPVVPSSQGNTPLCYVPEEKAFRWPLWGCGLPLEVVVGMLCSGFNHWETGRDAIGIRAVFESERFSSNKRLYFSPSRSL